MKKALYLMSLLAVVMGLVACSGGTTCENGEEPNSDGSCPSGDDDAT